MTELTPREMQRLRQANKVANQGKRAAAETLFRELIAESPHLPAAWLGVARLTRDADEREAALHKVLAIEPDNAIAQAALVGGDLDLLLQPEPEPEPEPEPVAELPIATNGAPATAGSMPPIVPPAIDAPEHDHAHDADVGGLRCNRCGKPIDVSDAVRTPVGYRCRECVRELESALFSATAIDYVIATVIALPLALIAATLVVFVVGGMAGFFSFIITLFVSPTVGTFIATLVFRAVGRRRGRYLPHTLAGVIWVAALLLFLALFLVTGQFVGLLLLGIFAFSASGAAFWRVR